MKITLGAVGKPGTSRENKTGSWRRGDRPYFKGQKCTNCNLCSLTCPDGCIYEQGKKVYFFDYDYCKGCGICAQVCPVKDIDMLPE
jgi:pyruvate ferredoxin oxidoreductase delta subunit